MEAHAGAVVGGAERRGGPAGGPAGPGSRRGCRCGVCYVGAGRREPRRTSPHSSASMEVRAATILALVTHHTHDLTDRLARAQKAAAEAGMDALLISPGADLRYLTGYEALPLERLTCLVLPASGDPLMVVPALEKPAAEASPLGGLGLEIVPLGRDRRPLRAGRLAAAGGAADRRPGQPHVGREGPGFRRVLPGAEQALAGQVLGDLRMRKTAAEVESLRAAGAAIDAVHRRVAGVAASRAHRARGRQGHRRRDPGRRARRRSTSSSSAPGPNGASPHHELSDRVIEAGRPGRRRHRRRHARRLLLGLHPQLQPSARPRPSTPSTSRSCWPRRRRSATPSAPASPPRSWTRSAAT